MVGHIKGCHVKVFYFFDFFELIMSNPSPKPRPTSSEIGRNLFKILKYLSMFLYPNPGLNALITWSTIFYLFGCSSVDEPFWYLLHKKSLFDIKKMKMGFLFNENPKPLSQYYSTTKIH